MSSIICVSMILLFLIWFSWFIIKPYINKKNEVYEMDIKNDKYKIFTSINPADIDLQLNEYVEGFVKRYITYKFISVKKTYIKQEEAEDMVKDITKLIFVNISELYIFYFKMVQSVKDDEELLAAIHSKVQSACIEAVSNFNNLME